MPVVFRMKKQRLDQGFTQLPHSPYPWNGAFVSSIVVLSYFSSMLLVAVLLLIFHRSSCGRECLVNGHHGYIFQNRQCFVSLASNANWHMARNLCHAWHPAADLPVLLDEESTEFLTDQFWKNSPWLGLTHTETDEHWLWHWIGETSGEEIHFSNWCDGEPEWAKSEACGGFRVEEGGCWDSISCDELRGVVCSVPLCSPGLGGETCSVYAQEQEQPEFLGVSHDGDCYVDLHELLPHSDAKQSCQELFSTGEGEKEKSHLAYIKTESTSAFFDAQFGRVGPWIGLTGETLTSWMWGDGTTLEEDHFADWCAGEPTGGDEEECVTLWYDGTSGCWNDYECEAFRDVVCVVPIEQQEEEDEDPGMNVTACSFAPSSHNTLHGYLFEGVCYLPMRHSQAFSRARSICRGLHSAAFLPRVWTAETNDMLKQYIGEAEDHASFWLGTMEKTGFGWHWSDGEVIMYADFCEGEEADEGDCLEMFRMADDLDDNYYCWRPVSCTKHLAFVCAVPLECAHTKVIVDDLYEDEEEECMEDLSSWRTSTWTVTGLFIPSVITNMALIVVCFVLCLCLCCVRFRKQRGSGHERLEDAEIVDGSEEDAFGDPVGTEGSLNLYDETETEGLL